MAWTTPITWTASLVTVAQMNTHIRDNENFLRGFHGARMYQNAALSNLDSTWQLVTWDTSDYSSDGIAVVASDWFVVPSGLDGYYKIGGMITFSGNATGVRQVKIMKNETYTVRAPNGVGTSLRLGPSAINAGGSAIVGLNIGWQGPLAVGDHVTIETWQSSGTNLPFNIGIDSMAVEIQYLGS